MIAKIRPRPLLLAAMVVAAALPCLPSVALAAAKSSTAAKPAVSCESLAKLALPGAIITLAETVAAGAYRLPAGNLGGGQFGGSLAGRATLDPNPAFCRIAATLKPSAASNIRIEVWMPQSGWNGKFLGVGNGGWGGQLVYFGMLTGLIEGYATASNDTGHDSSGPDGGGGRFALLPSEKIIDYAYRANHEMTVSAKAFINAFYGTAPNRSYWIGCSLGGLQGLIEAKRYPADYDGIVVGAPPNPITNFNAAQLYPGVLVGQDSARAISREKFALVHQAVIKQCASPLGQKDGVVDQPDHCEFDPQQLLCKGADAPDCLTAPQVYLLQQLYAGPTNPRTGEKIFLGPALGSELELFAFASGNAFPNALDLFRYAAFHNADWNWKAMDFDQDVAAASSVIGPLMHVDSNLQPYFDRGGKLLLYVGWNDYHNPIDLMAYHQALIRNSGGNKVAAALRLFTIPGMNHCAGGAGCDTFNKLGVIDSWVTRAQAPERIVASRVEAGKVVRTRPLCAYPKIAKYRGSGAANDAASFSCATQ